MTTVRLGVVGAGLVGRRHIDVIAACPELELACIVEPGVCGVEIATQNDCSLYGSIESMLAEDKPDGVIIATPNTLHVEQALQCIDQNIAVLVEKPIAASSRDAEKLVLEADQANVPLLVGHHRRRTRIDLQP